MTQDTASSLPLASVVLNPGMLCQPAGQSMDVPSCSSFDSASNDDNAGSFLFNSFSASNGVVPGQQYWNCDSSPPNFRADGLSLIMNPLTRNVSPSFFNEGNSILLRSDVQQRSRFQDGRLFIDNHRQEFPGFSQTSRSGGCGGFPQNPSGDFRWNLTDMMSHVGPNTYGNFNISTSGLPFEPDKNYISFNSNNTTMPLPLHSSDRTSQSNEQCIQQNQRFWVRPEETSYGMSRPLLHVPNNCFTPTQETESYTQISHPSSHGPKTLIKNLDYNGQRQLLLLYYHARLCSNHGVCTKVSCMKMKKIIHHMKFCRGSCNTCIQLDSLLSHHRSCQDLDCPVCAPVRRIVREGSLGNFRVGSTEYKVDIPEPSSKRLKGECFSVGLTEIQKCGELSPGEQLSGHSCKSVVTGSPGEVKPYDYSSQGSSVNCCEVKFDDSEITDEEIPINSKMNRGLKPCESSTKLEKMECIAVEKQVPEKEEVLKENQAVVVSDDPPMKTQVNCDLKPDSRCQNLRGVSLVESFTLEQVLDHMSSLKKWVGLGKVKAAKNQALENDDKNSCQLCGTGALSFEPPPIYCVKCYGRIKHNRAYHTMVNCDTLKKGGAGRLYLCNPCFNGSHGDSVTYVGGVLTKAKLEKKRNDVQVLEQWVECDKCKSWQHQICALFNAKRNVGGKAGYTCPNCYVEEMKCSEFEPLPDGVILGAQDLPRSKLSDHIEQRLVLSLVQERQERAHSLQKSYNEVPGAENLIVRVVSSVDKKLEVKKLFRQIFEEKGYPAEFPYKSKAILLFQKIEGADVCLFAMYVQEYGSGCSEPNQRRVCLSYLDSVKYFRPDVKCVTGEALRTFVYHEILIAYLDFCKKRGFTSCHIWSCPPLKQEDFILNCHPEIQKTPKPDKLREWYLAMIRKATKKNIVVENTKLYDFFFMPPENCKASLTAARLPYFDGDYWPGCAEDLLQSLQQIEDGKEPPKKGKMSISKRALKAARHCSSTDTPSKDSLLMFKLGEVIRPMKDDLIMIHLQHVCSQCCQMILSGKRWVCNQCKKFQLCNKCYDANQSLEEKARHPISSSDKHTFQSVDVEEVPVDTVDDDENLESEFFDSRLAFLNLCQGNHYQNDTLRRAKHSTMMILYHLHNPSIPAFVASCFNCHVDIEPGLGWHCESCPDYDLCASCYGEKGRSGHPHELVRHTSASHSAISDKARSRIQLVLELLVHASRCREMHCEYPSCRHVKGLFHHGAMCKVRVAGGCHSCKKMWYILRLHARACKEGNKCLVPRCRDLKEHMRKMESQSESRRRFAAMEMMRSLEQTAAADEEATASVAQLDDKEAVRQSQPLKTPQNAL
ncbi:histone acetyltransferase HAC12-like isoform X2 [Wolffia australiana]